MKERKTAYIVFTVLIYLGCSLLFIVIMKDIWLKYRAQITSTGKKYLNKNYFIARQKPIEL